MGKMIISSMYARGGFKRAKAHFTLCLSGSLSLHAPRKRGFGKTGRDLVSREFGAIYVERDADARTGCKVRGRTDERGGYLREKYEKVHLLSIQNRSHMGGVGV